MTTLASFFLMRGEMQRPPELRQRRRKFSSHFFLRDKRLKTVKNHFSISRKSPSWNGSWFWDEMDENETINQAEQASLFVEAGYNNDVFEILSETCPRLNAWPCFAKNSAFIGLVGFDLFFVRRNMIVLLLLFRWTSRFNYLSVVRSRFSHVLVDFLFVMQVILWNKNVQPIYFLVNLIFRDNY